jgi:hypothetical protein
MSNGFRFNRAGGRAHFVPMMIGGLLVLGMTVYLAPVAAAASDAVSNCSGSGAGSLPAVVAGADSGDTVTFSVSCPSSSPITLNGPVDITQNLTIEGPGPSALVVSGNNENRDFEITGDVTVAISGLTIEDGVAPPGGNGGGIDNAGILTLTNDAVSGNITRPGVDGTDGQAGTNAVGGGSGGGIENTGTLTLTDDTVSGNATGGGGNGGSDVKNGGNSGDDGGDGANGGNGGGIDNSGTLTVTNDTVSDNTTGTGGNGGDNDGKSNGNGGNGGDGGGIYNSGTVSLTDDTVSGNVTGVGGAAGFKGHKVSGTVGDGGAGGGLSLSQNSQGTVSDSTLAGNKATGTFSAGGGIVNSSEEGLVVSNSTLAGNSASSGGGIAVGDVSMTTMTNSTVVSNSAYGRGNVGGGIDGGTFIVEATVVAQNSPGTDCLGGIIDDGYNIDDDGTCGFTADTDISDTSADLDPSGLADNGGPTQTVALETGSHAVAAVTNASLCATPDQRGVARPTPCDIGAIELAVAPLPSQTITFSSTPPTSATVGGPAYDVSATASSGLPVTLTVDTSASSVCQISGSTVSLIGVGTCTIDANQDGDASFAPALLVQQSFSVGVAPEAIASPDTATAVVGTAFTFTVSTTGAPAPVITAKGKLPKHLTLVSNGNGTATISGTPIKAGTFTFTIEATFGKGKAKSVVAQPFTLTVNSA